MSGPFIGVCTRGGCICVGVCVYIHVGCVIQYGGVWLSVCMWLRDVLWVRVRVMVSEYAHGRCCWCPR